MRRNGVLLFDAYKILNIRTSYNVILQLMVPTERFSRNSIPATSLTLAQFSRIGWFSLFSGIYFVQLVGYYNDHCMISGLAGS